MSVVALRVRENQCLRICVCEDERMADASISSKAKAELVRNQVSSSSDLLAHDPAVPLLAAFGQKGLALCLVDSENFEVAVPHSLFSEALLDAETVLELTESTRIPSTIGRVVGKGAAAQAVQDLVNSMSKGDLSDVSALSKQLSLSLEAAQLPAKTGWLEAKGQEAVR